MGSAYVNKHTTSSHGSHSMRGTRSYADGEEVCGYIEGSSANEDEGG